MVAGTGRFDTRLMERLGERVFCKVGAEGVYCAALPEVGLCAEPADCEQVLAGLLEPDMPPRLWTDTYLAAFALAGGLRLVTFDKDFARFAGAARLQLSATAPSRP